MRYIASVDRDQLQLAPLCLDDMVDENNPCRLIDVFCDSLNMKELGFKNAETAETGRPPFDPREFLKLYLYGYYNTITSSGRLAMETTRNIEVMWLIHNLRPKKRVLCYFKANNEEAIKKVFREFNKFYKQLGLFGNEIIGVDSVKIRANNGKKNNHTRTAVEKRLKQLEENIDKYFKMLSETDEQENDDGEPQIPVSQIKEILSSLQEKKQKYENYHQQINESKEEQISTVDVDSRLMKQGSGKGLHVSYNTQVAVDSKNKMIVEFETTNQANDLGRLENITEKAKEFLETKKIIALADSGYYDSTDILKCEGKGTTCLVPATKKSHQAKDSKYSIENFSYDKEKNMYTCPEGIELKFMREVEKDGKVFLIYANYSTCRNCPVKDLCTKCKKGREVSRSSNQDEMDMLNIRFESMREIYDKRLEIVEHPFGTIKWVWGFNRYQTRGFKKVGTENALIFCTYNLKRAVNIVGIKKLIEEIRSRFPRFWDMLCKINFISWQKLSILQNIYILIMN